MRACPVCADDGANAVLFMEEHVDASLLSEYSFASRKVPEFMNHRLMRCRTCDVLYVPDPPPQGALANAYHQAAYDSSEEADDAARSYIRALDPVLAKLKQKEAALEIGAGTGVFLEQLETAGFAHVMGVEPSAAAIAAAPARRRSWIRQDIFVEKNFAPESLDFICCFMTMEHVADPKAVAQGAMRLLRPGGCFATVTHDYRSTVNRLLGARSPIIDIEHMQIFSQKSIRRLFEGSGYREIESRKLLNKYALSYWARLSPLPPKLKARSQHLLRALHMDNSKLALNVGNVVTAGFK